MTWTNTDGLEWQISDATATKADGVFSATVVWDLKVPIEGTQFDMLPDVVAARFIAAGILPIEGYTYPPYQFASVRTVTCKRVEGGIYTYTAEYSDKNSSEKKATDENPLNDLPIIKPSAGMITRTLTRDLDDKAILNSAGDPILQTFEDNVIGLSVTSNVPYVPAEFMALRNKRNLAAFTIGGVPVSAKAARFVLPSNWVSEPKARNDVSYLEFTYELILDEIDLHDGRPLDAGFRWKYSDSPLKIITILNEDGSEPSEPILLDGSGHINEDPNPDTAVYLRFEKYPTADFSILPGVI